MLFVNISSDKVHISDWNKNKYLDRNGIEDTLWRELVSWNKKNSITQIFLLNWPGWFTNLRVGTLCINLLNKLYSNKIKIYNQTKVDLYKYLFEKWFLPRHGIIYIWQKNNVRKYDFKLNKYDVVDLKETKKVDNCFYDYVAWDYRLNNKRMLSFTCKENSIIIKYGWKKINLYIKDFKIKTSFQVKPNYLINPINN